MMKIPFALLPICAALVAGASSLSAAVISQGATIVQVSGTGGTFGGSEGPSNVVDGTTNKYYSSQGAGPNPYPTLQITPTLTSTVIQSVTIFTGNDSINRDPTLISIFGSLDGITFVPIALNQTIALPSTGTNYSGSGTPEARNNTLGVAVTTPGLYSASIGFANSTAYNVYQVRIDAVRTPGNGAQFSELQLNTSPIPEPSSALLGLAGSLSLLARRRR